MLYPLEVHLRGFVGTLGSDLGITPIPDFGDSSLRVALASGLPWPVRLFGITSKYVGEVLRHSLFTPDGFPWPVLLFGVAFIVFLFLRSLLRRFCCSSLFT